MPCRRVTRHPLPIGTKNRQKAVASVIAVGVTLTLGACGHNSDPPPTTISPTSYSTPSVPDSTTTSIADTTTTSPRPNPAVAQWTLHYGFYLTKFVDDINFVDNDFATGVVPDCSTVIDDSNFALTLPDIPDAHLEGELRAASAIMSSAGLTCAGVEDFIAPVADLVQLRASLGIPQQ